MYIGDFEEKKEKTASKKSEDFFARQKESSVDEGYQEKEAFNRMYLKNALLSWRAPEHEIIVKDKRWHIYAALILTVIVAYAVYTNSPVMAITFILVGVVGYIILNKEPLIVNFAITRDGVVANRSIYEFENIQSFWIFYEPNQANVISLHMKNKLIPYVHIPLHEEDPVAIRELLLEYIPEIKQEHSLVDTFERLLGI